MTEEQEDEQQFEQLMKDGDRFNEFNGKKTCRDCGYAMPFEDSVVCGVWHHAFSINSLCDQFKTEVERKEELRQRMEVLKNDPNSVIYKRLHKND